MLPEMGGVAVLEADQDYGLDLDDDDPTGLLNIFNDEPDEPEFDGEDIE